MGELRIEFGNANSGGQDIVVDEDVDEQVVQDLALNVDNTMFMANLSFADPVYDEANPSYDSDILSERIAELKSENSNLQNKIQNDDHNVMVQSRGNTIRELREKISRLTKKHRDADLIHDQEAKVERPLDRSLASACLYTKHSQELLEYVIGTCPKDFNQRDKKHAATP
nr:hypothetical protein [Tanacetum cinerariifolium]